MGVCLFVLLAAGTGFAASERFDVVSIKATPPEERNVAVQILPGGSLRMIAVPLRMVIMPAYDVTSFQIVGGPDWIRTERWDILAKADGIEGKLPLVELRAMLRLLLADRFALRAHRETRTKPVYALVVDKKGAKIGVHTGAVQQQVRNGIGSLNAKDVGMRWLAMWLSQQLGRSVADQTGLAGEYDISLAWTPEVGEGNPEFMGLPPENPRHQGEGNGPSIFTALQQQLGLRLVSRKGPVEVVVIDRVERPSAN